MGGRWLGVRLFRGTIAGCLLGSLNPTRGVLALFFVFLNKKTNKLSGAPAVCASPAQCADDGVPLGGGHSGERN